MKMFVETVNLDISCLLILVKYNCFVCFNFDIRMKQTRRSVCVTSVCLHSLTIVWTSNLMQHYSIILPRILKLSIKIRPSALNIWIWSVSRDICWRCLALRWIHKVSMTNGVSNSNYYKENSNKDNIERKILFVCVLLSPKIAYISVQATS